MAEIAARRVDAAARDRLIAGGIDPRLAHLYAARGVTTPAELDYRLAALLPPGQLAHAERAAVFLADAIAAKRRMLIVADYDSLLHNLGNHLVQDQQYHPDNTAVFSENSGASYLANTRWNFSSSAAKASASVGDFALL